MPGRRKRLTLEEELAELAGAIKDPRTPEALTRLRAALASPRSQVVARAARTIKDRALEGFDSELRAAFERFLANPVKTDPNCQAKLATLEALDYLETMDETPFLLAVRYVQMEPAWGPPVDTATGVRARAAVALARIGHGEVPLLMAELLADKEPSVRQAAADALALYGDRTGAGIVLLKLTLGDDDPMVTLACMSALLQLAPEAGLLRLGALLEGEDETQSELAAMALGQSRRDDALDRLLAALADAVQSVERVKLLKAIALHRSDRALATLLATVAEGRSTEASAAVEALGVRAFEPGLAERVRAAAARNEDVDLTDVLRRSFERA